jgi:hypothetical protein
MITSPLQLVVCPSANRVSQLCRIAAYLSASSAGLCHDRKYDVQYVFRGQHRFKNTKTNGQT